MITQRRFNGIADFAFAQCKCRFIEFRSKAAAAAFAQVAQIAAFVAAGQIFGVLSRQFGKSIWVRFEFSSHFVYFGFNFRIACFISVRHNWNENMRNFGSWRQIYAFTVISFLHFFRTDGLLVSQIFDVQSHIFQLNGLRNQVIFLMRFIILLQNRIIYFYLCRKCFRAECK